MAFVSVYVSGYLCFMLRDEKKNDNGANLVLGIETSCDETAIALLNTDGDLVYNDIYSQIDIHAQYGGVVPEVASRSHVVQLQIMMNKLKKETGINANQIAAIATTGPGLIGGLIVGATFAKGMCQQLGVPFIGVNHLEGHILSAQLTHKQCTFPFVAMLVSGGHCQIVMAHSLGNYTLLAQTLDDAAGEAFDKTARMLGFNYPGGKQIDDYAKRGDKHKYLLPVAKLKNTKNKSFFNAADMSFSGLKTATATIIKNITANEPLNINETDLDINNVNNSKAVKSAAAHKNATSIKDVIKDNTKQAALLTEKQKEDLSASIQYTITQTLQHSLTTALQSVDMSHEQKKLVICGGVAANSSIREMISSTAKEHEYKVFMPEMQFCTDNGAMIAMAGLRYYQAGIFSSLDCQQRPRWPLQTMNQNIRKSVNEGMNEGK